MSKARRISRARDKRADMQLQENIRSSDKPTPHADTHAQSGNDTVTPSSIGAETPAAAQVKADTAKSEAISSANGYTDTEVANLQQQIDDLEARVTALENA